MVVENTTIGIAATQRYDVGEIIVIDMRNASFNDMLIRINDRISLTGSAIPNRMDQIKMEFFSVDICSYALEN